MPEVSRGRLMCIYYVVVAFRSLSYDQIGVSPVGAVSTATVASGNAVRVEEGILKIHP